MSLEDQKIAAQEHLKTQTAAEIRSDHPELGPALDALIDQHVPRGSGCNREEPQSALEELL